MTNKINERSIDHCAVRAFSEAMIAKLDKKRAEGRSGWHDPVQCSIEELCIMLANHIRKGDMVDIANFCMMIWARRNLPRTAAREGKKS